MLSRQSQNWIIKVSVEKVFKIFGYSNRVQLVWVNKCVEDLFSSWDGISDTNDVTNIL